MRTAFIIISLMVGVYIFQLAYFNIETSVKISKSNKEQRLILKDLEKKENELILLEDQPIGSLQDSYKQIIKKIRLFSRSQDLKTVIDFQKSINRLSKGLKNNDISIYKGIEQIPMEIKFVGVKGEEGLLKIIGFLDQLESSNSLRVINIYQSAESLQTRVQIYGREL